jgi:hypothetical protein
MGMPIHLAVMFLFAQPTPDAMLDNTWGALARSAHEHGSWRVVHDGQTYKGNWKVTSADLAYNPGAHQAVQQRWIHYVSSQSADYCAVATEDPTIVYCRNAKTCPDRFNCRSVRFSARVMSYVIDRSPTLADEQMLFERIHRRTLAEALGAAVVTSTPDRLTLSLGYRVDGAAKHLEHGFDRVVTSYVATIEIASRPRELAITSRRQTDQFVERCTYPASHMSSCTPMPPTCVRTR